MGVSTINPVNLLPAVPGIVLGIAMLVIARSERIAREAAAASRPAEERRRANLGGHHGRLRAGVPSAVGAGGEDRVGRHGDPAALVALTLGLGAISLVLLPLGAVGFPIYLKVAATRA